MGLPRAHAHRYGFAGKQASPFKLDLTADCWLMLQRNAPEPQNPRARPPAPAADTNIMANPDPIINLVDRGRIMVDASQKRASKYGYVETGCHAQDARRGHAE